MDAIWEKLHSSRAWGKYPSEDLIRTVMRSVNRDKIQNYKVLEVGCGAGANLSFFLNEGFQVYGVDGAPSAISKAKDRLEKLKTPEQTLELHVQEFTQLDWPENYFDIVVDCWAIYANKFQEIEKALAECFRVLKPGGYFYSRSWAMGCFGSQSGEIIEPGTSLNPSIGPCANMGTSHFFTREELDHLYFHFSNTRIRHSSIIEMQTKEKVDEWIVWAQK